MDTQHVRTMLGARTIRCRFKTGKTKDKPDQLFFNKCADDQPAIVNGGDEHMCRDNVGFTARPHGTLQVFNRSHFFGSFKDFYKGSRHRVVSEAGSSSFGICGFGKALQERSIPGIAFKIIILETRSEEHTSELQSLTNLVCRLLLEKTKKL